MPTYNYYLDMKYSQDEARDFELVYHDYESEDVLL